ncbi:MAG: site-2 protease family protein [Candidatus Paceibacterota bacterium]|jgi:Zn-dependent protease
MEITIVFALIILLFSIIIHEIAHGSVAYSLGDSTAKNSGRLTLNPIKHLDPVGSILLPVFLSILSLPIIGWAKPVPINPFNFNDQKWGELKVSIAGPLANFAIALIFGLVIMFFSLPESFLEIASLVIIYNIALGIFNLIPVPPLDGSHILFALLGERFNNVKKFLYQYGFFVLIFLVFSGGINWVFNFSYWVTSLFFKFSLV